MQFLFYILLIFAFYCSVFCAPKSRHTILQNTDGQVMPAGTLANLENLSFDVLVRDYLGANNAGGSFYIFNTFSILLLNRFRENSKMACTLWINS